MSRVRNTPAWLGAQRVVSLCIMTVAWVPVLCSKLGNQTPRSGLMWGAGLLEEPWGRGGGQ